MRQGYKHVRNALKDYCEYYHQEIDRLGYPAETPEYKMYTTGVRKENRREFDDEGAFIGLPWMSQRETKQAGKNFTPMRLKSWPNRRLRQVGVAVSSLPVKQQKIVHAIFHPERGRDIRNEDFCSIFNVSAATLNRRIRCIYQEISRMLGICLD